MSVSHLFVSLIFFFSFLLPSLLQNSHFLCLTRSHISSVCCWHNWKVLRHFGHCNDCIYLLILFFLLPSLLIFYCNSTSFSVSCSHSFPQSKHCHFFFCFLSIILYQSHSVLCLVWWYFWWKRNWRNSWQLPLSCEYRFFSFNERHIAKLCHLTPYYFYTDLNTVTVIWN